MNAAALLLNLLINGLAVWTATYVLKGVHAEGFGTALVVAIVLGVLNTFVKPVLVFLTLPITVVTFGLFLLVINAGVILLAAKLVPGFQVDGFGWALLFSLAVSAVASFLNLLAFRA